MIGATLELLRRVQQLVDPREKFFDVAAQWYKNVESSRRVARLLLGKCGEARLALIVNGRQMVAEAPAPDEGTRLWELPAEHLHAGTNEVAVLVDTVKVDVHIRAAALGDDEQAERDVIDFASASPPATPRLWLAPQQKAVHSGNHWILSDDGRLTFHVRLAAPRSVLFSLRLLLDRTEATLTDVKKLLEDVRDRVEAKKKEMEKELRAKRRLERPQADALNDAISALEAYLKLHDVQIAPAFGGPDSGTLAQIIAKTGHPDTLVQSALAPPAVQPAFPAAVHDVFAAPRAQPMAAQPAAQATPRLAPRPPRPVAKGSVFGKLLKLAFAGTVTVGGLGYAAYATDNLPKPVADWVRKAIAEVKSWVPGQSGDVLTALRQSADELGWKRDGEQVLSKETALQLMKLAEALQGEKVAMPALEGDVRYYAVGERMPGAPDIPLENNEVIIPFRRQLIVFDLKRAEATASYIELTRKNLQNPAAGEFARNMGIRVEIVPLKVPGSDGAFAAKSSANTGRLMTQSFARVGQYIISTGDADPLPEGSEIQEIERRLTVLASKLQHAATKGTSQAGGERPAPGDKKDEDREGVLGVPLPGARNGEKK